VFGVPGSREAAALAGLVHDLGKYTPHFQQRLLTGRRDPRGHAAIGAAWLGRGDDPIRQHLAFLVAGHHGGLPGRRWLQGRMQETLRDPDTAAAWEAARADLGQLGAEPLPRVAAADLEFWLRMLFSCLIDADRLDTERHFRPARAARRGAAPPLADLELRLRTHLDVMSVEGPVNAVRQEVRRACEAAAAMPPGFFRLAVPTGGGKTLSSLAFALGHARLHGLRRVVVAVPYRTVTEQTADVYRAAFRTSDPAVVLVHHSQVEPGDAESDERRDLLVENWDAPVVVTTHVRLFEGLFACQPSACRRLHSVARAVLVVDEAQVLPPRLLLPLLEGLRQLVAHYGATVVFSTATQPALEDRQGFAGVPNLRDIVPDPARYFTLPALRRVHYDLEPLKGPPWDARRLAVAMGEESQALAVLNTRRDAVRLYKAMDGAPGRVLLTSNLCPAHRRKVLDEIGAALPPGTRCERPCHVAATQLVEAGVNLDFPAVFRVLGPLDSIVQAAGRCNREGDLRGADGRPRLGRVTVFRLAGGGLPRDEAYQTATAEAEAVLGQAGVDLYDPGVFAAYFERLYRMTAEHSREQRAIADARAHFDYPETARLFRLVPDEGVPVVVTYGDSPAAVAAAQRELCQAGWLSRETARRLRPYTVELRAPQRYAGLLEEVAPGILLWRGEYDEVRGLVRPGEEV
jgi:CRISPR-associated endonuclease/helicase Cas3